MDGLSLDVPASAEDVLRQVRLEHQLRTLWIDAVCINETDIREKSCQVAIMAEIYSRTFRNLIWLGKVEAEASKVACAIEAILNEAMNATDDFRELCQTLYDTKGHYRYAERGFITDVDAPSKPCSIDHGFRDFGYD